MYSLIIPSYNRADEIEALLTSLKQLDFPGELLEIIIVDDGSTDNTADIVENFTSDFPFSIRYFSQQNAGPAVARNTGMKHANGDFFIFLDSDVTVPSDWLKKIDADLKEFSGDAFGGPDTDRKDFPPLLKAINHSMTSFLTTGGMRGRKGKKLAKYYPRSFNMGLSRKVYEEIGEFYPLRHGQDIEYSNRIIRSGARVLFIDSPVFHKRRTSVKKFFKQVFNWGVARINLAKIDPNMLEFVHLLPAFAFLLVVFFLAFAVTSLFIPALFPFTMGGIVVGLFYLLLIALSGGWRYKSIKVFLLLFIIAPIQILGYGLGLVFNGCRRYIFKKGETAGITKNYYG